MPPRLPQARGNGCRGATGLPSAQGEPYFPGRLTITHACRKLTILDVCKIRRSHVWQMDFVHLLSHLRAVKVAAMGSACAVFGISESCLFAILREGGKHFVAYDLVEALGGCCELLHVAVSERTKLRPVQKRPVLVVQDDVDRVGSRAVW